MKILITGSMGFVGSHMMTVLKDRGHEIFGMDIKVGSDAANINYVQQIITQLFPAPDLVLHLASTCSTVRGITVPAEAFKNNVLSVFSMLEACRQLGIPNFMFLSSCKVTPGDDGKQTPYGATKVMCEEWIKTCKDTYGINYIINRPGTIYGQGQDGSSESGWVAWFLKANNYGLPITIFGDGEQVRDILHIDDMVALLVDQIENFDKYKNNTYDVGGGLKNALKVIDLINFLGHESITFADKRLGDASSYIADNTKVSTVNSWEPRVYWKDGIRMLLDSAKKHNDKGNDGRTKGSD